MYQYRFSNDVLALLRRRGVHSILGNHDKTVLHAPSHPLRSSPTVDPSYLRYLAGLPNTISMQFGKTVVQMFHGSPWDDDHGRVTPYLYPQDRRQMQRLAELPADVVILGHTHVPFAHREGRVLIMNPGSCAEPRDGSNEQSCAVLDSATLEIDFRRFRLAPA